MSNILGYIFAFISSFFSTLYIIPKKISKQKPINYVMFMGLGFFCISLIMYFVNKIYNKDFIETLLDPLMILASLTGVFWMLGSLCVLTAIDRMGLSRANQWKTMQGPIGAFLSLIILSEFLNTKVMYIFFATISICISAILFTVKARKEDKIDKVGICYGLLSATLFGITALLQKYISEKGLIFNVQVYLSLFIFISAYLYIIIKQKGFKNVLVLNHKDNWLAIVGGIIYYFTSYFLSLAYKIIPGSIAYTINQFSAVWTLLVGVIIFKEINFKNHWKRLLVGIVFSIIGIVMLLFAQK